VFDRKVATGPILTLVKLLMLLLPDAVNGCDALASITHTSGLAVLLACNAQSQPLYQRLVKRHQRWTSLTHESLNANGNDAAQHYSSRSHLLN
jgi:hypothetical protein